MVLHGLVDRVIFPNDKGMIFDGVPYVEVMGCLEVMLGYDSTKEDAADTIAELKRRLAERQKNNR